MPRETDNYVHLSSVVNTPVSDPDQRGCAVFCYDCAAEMDADATLSFNGFEIPDTFIPGVADQTTLTKLKAIIAVHSEYTGHFPHIVHFILLS
jgi:hypothetical protein